MSSSVSFLKVRDKVSLTVPRCDANWLFEIGWAVVRSALEGDSQIPLERALNTLNQIVGLGLLPRSR